MSQDIVRCKSRIELIGITVSQQDNRGWPIFLQNAKPPCIIIRFLEWIALQADIVLGVFPDRTHKLVPCTLRHFETGYRLTKGESVICVRIIAHKSYRQHEGSKPDGFKAALSAKANRSLYESIGHPRQGDGT